MARTFAFAIKNNIVLGGPDVVPYRKGQMQNSYKFFHRYKGKLKTAFAIQDTDYLYTNPKTKKKFTFKELICFAKNYLGANYLFLECPKKFVPAITTNSIAKGIF